MFSSFYIAYNSILFNYSICGIGLDVGHKLRLRIIYCACELGYVFFLFFSYSFYLLITLNFFLMCNPVRGRKAGFFKIVILSDSLSYFENNCFVFLYLFATLGYSQLSVLKDCAPSIVFYFKLHFQTYIIDGVDSFSKLCV